MISQSRSRSPMKRGRSKSARKEGGVSSSPKPKGTARTRARDQARAMQQDNVSQFKI